MTTRLTEELDVVGGPAPTDLEVVLSAEWLTAALGVDHPGVRVDAASLVERLDHTATKARFEVGYEDRAGHALPNALCVKGYFGEERRQWRTVGAREARFYAWLRPLVEIEVPRCVYAGFDPATGHGLVVMEDLVVGGATFLTALSPYGPDQVAATLGLLAGLHASRWDDAETAALAWLDPIFPTYVDAVTDARLAELLADDRRAGLPGEILQPTRIKAALGALAKRFAARPATVVHADAHAGNLYVGPNGAPGLIDWCTYQRSCWSLDVAYHIGAVLDPEVRRVDERDLVRHYLGELASRGVPAPTFHEAWDDYRVSLTFGYFMWAITQRVDPAITFEFNRRLGTAVADHESFDRLGV